MAISAFLNPTSFSEAAALLAQDPAGSRIIGGGSAVTLLIQQRRFAAERLISLARIPGAGSITSAESHLHLGPMATMTDVIHSGAVRGAAGVLAQAAAEVGHKRVQNQATLAGNLAEADYATDIPAALLVLDAQVNILSPSAERQTAVDSLIEGPFRTTLGPAEIITGIQFAPLGEGWRSLYLKYRSRSTEDRPCVGVAVAARFTQNICHELRLAVCGACERAQRLANIEALVQGQPLSPNIIAAVAEAYAQYIPTVDNLRGSAWYHTRMIEVHVRRALERLRDDHR